MQYTRTLTLPCLLFELFPLISFPCPGHNSRLMLKGINSNCIHSVEVQCLRTITLSCLILLLSLFYTFSIFVIYMNQELFKVSIIGHVHISCLTCFQRYFWSFHFRWWWVSFIWNWESSHMGSKYRWNSQAVHR